jgi:hypothetical protein
MAYLLALDVVVVVLDAEIFPVLTDLTALIKYHMLENQGLLADLFAARDHFKKAAGILHLHAELSEFLNRLLIGTSGLADGFGLATTETKVWI